MKTCAAVLAACLVAAAPALAQRGPLGETSLLAGPSWYDLSGTGTSVAANLSTTMPLAGRVLLISPNFGFFTYRTRFGGRRWYLFPELGVQLQAPLGRFRPYVGAGVGAAIDTKGGPSQFDATLHAVTGIRLRVSGDWGARVEFRLRSVDPWSGNTGDLGFGITRGIP